MAELTPEHPPRPVTVRFNYYVSDEWIETQIAETGEAPAERITLEVALKDVPDPETRRRLLRAEAGCDAAKHYPLLPRPEQDVLAFLAQVEQWLVHEHPGRSSLAFEGEMRSWVADNGSARLKMAVARDYKANATYVRERAAVEYPTFWVHTANKDLWRERTDPSLDALETEQRVSARVAERGDSDLEVRIVWLVAPPRDLDVWLDARDEMFEESEAILLSPYLGRYALLEPLDLPRMEGSDDDS
jgi:hypothetical protein